MNIRPLQFHRNVLTWAERFLTEPLKFTCSEVASGVFWGLKNAGNQLLINYWVSNKYQLRNSEGQGRKSCGGGGGGGGETPVPPPPPLYETLHDNTLKIKNKNKFFLDILLKLIMGFRYT